MDYKWQSSVQPLRMNVRRADKYASKVLDGIKSAEYYLSTF
jgi:hypothetical protein